MVAAVVGELVVEWEAVVLVLVCVRSGKGVAVVEVVGGVVVVVGAAVMSASVA